MQSTSSVSPLRTSQENTSTLEKTGSKGSSGNKSSAVGPRPICFQIADKDNSRTIQRISSSSYDPMIPIVRECIRLSKSYARATDYERPAQMKSEKIVVRRMLLGMIKNIASKHKAQLKNVAQEIAIDEPWAKGLVACITNRHAAKGLAKGMGLVVKFLDAATYLDQLLETREFDAIYQGLSALLNAYLAIQEGDQGLVKIQLLNYLSQSNHLWSREFDTLTASYGGLERLCTGVCERLSIASLFSTQEVRRKLSESLEQTLYANAGTTYFDLTQTNNPVLFKEAVASILRAEENVCVSFSASKVRLFVEVLKECSTSKEIYLDVHKAEDVPVDWKLLVQLSGYPTTFVTLHGWDHLDWSEIPQQYAVAMDKRLHRVTFPDVRYLAYGSQFDALGAAKSQGRLARVFPAVESVKISSSTALSKNTVIHLLQGMHRNLQWVKLTTNDPCALEDFLVSFPSLRGIQLDGSFIVKDLFIRRLVTELLFLEQLKVPGGLAVLKQGLEQLSVMGKSQSYRVPDPKKLTLAILAGRLRLRPYLRKLELRGGDFLNEKEVPLLPEMEHLKELDFMGTKLTAAQLKALLAMAPNLQEIHLSDVKYCPYHIDLSHRPAKIIKRVLGALGSVRSVDMTAADIKVSDLQKWGKKRWMRKLTAINLSDIRMPVAQLGILVDWLIARPKLQSFVLPQAVGMTAARLVVSRKWTTSHARSQRLYQCLQMNVARMGSVSLVHSEGCKLVPADGVALHVLSTTRPPTFRENVPLVEGVQALKPRDLQLLLSCDYLKKVAFPDLCYLNASDNSLLDDESLRNLALGARRLESLNLTRCHSLRMQTLRDICLAHSASLKHIDLSGCHWLDSIDLPAIAWPQALEVLVLNDTPLTRLEVQKLHWRLEPHGIQVCYTNHPERQALVEPDIQLVYKEGRQKCHRSIVCNQRSPLRSYANEKAELILSDLPAACVQPILDYVYVGTLPCVIGKEALQLGNQAEALGMGALALHCWRRFVYGVPAMDLVSTWEELDEDTPPWIKNSLTLKADALFNPQLSGFYPNVPRGLREKAAAWLRTSLGEYCLHEAPLSRWPGFYFDAETADLHIECKDSKVVYAHRAIVSLRSPYFFAALNTGMKEQQGKVIALPDVPENAMRIVRDYLYSGVVPDWHDWSVDALIQLYSTANYLMVDALTSEIVERLSETDRLREHYGQLCEFAYRYELRGFGKRLADLPHDVETGSPPIQWLQSLRPDTFV